MAHSSSTHTHTHTHTHTLHTHKHTHTYMHTHYTHTHTHTLHTHTHTQTHTHTHKHKHTLTQAIAVLPKNTCDVKRVEILKGVRLTKNSIEHFAIRVPRTRLEFFQDDIYPNTLVHWESALSASQWLEGKDSSQRTLSLQPPGMKPRKLTHFEIFFSVIDHVQII